MGKIILILGGVRSGKSTYAADIVNKPDKKVAFIATCLPQDQEMEERVRAHQRKRPKHWQTIVETKNLAAVIKTINKKVDSVIIDCLTLYISNLLLDKVTAKAIEKNIKDLLDMIKSSKLTAVIVSNEVGLGIVPVTPLGRNFRDLAGKINQIAASRADKVIFMVSGLPLIVKEKNEKTK